MSTSEHRPNLQILDGGRSLPVSRMHRILLGAYVTDTRLMGVLAVVSHWNITPPGADRDDPDNWEDLYQFIYIDCEEAGFETFQQVRGPSEEIRIEAERIEDAMVCGLGGKKIELNARQLRLLLQTWEQFNLDRGLPMPAGREQYDFLLDPVVEADQEERQELMRMICPAITSDEQAVNYFLMRCFGRDREGARFLIGADVPLDLFDDYTCATFCRNKIEEYSEDPNGAVTYRCESLIEMNGSYDMIVSLVTVRNLRVVGLSRADILSITSAEAAMILRKVEYVTLYEVFLTDEGLEENIDEFTLGFHTTMSEFKNGRLFMKFRQNNDHVDSRLFLLSNDVRGLYFLTNSKQLLLCAYTLEDVRWLESTIASSPLAPYLIPSGRYNFIPGHKRTPSGTLVFREPVMYEFMNSDYLHFEDFLQTLM